jgi:hypothetical protein
MTVELVARLRAMERAHSSPHILIDRKEAADLIETQAAEIERLRAVLDRIYMEDRRTVDRWRPSFATGDSHLDTHIVLGRYAVLARAALESKP